VTKVDFSEEYPTILISGIAAKIGLVKLDNEWSCQTGQRMLLSLKNGQKAHNLFFFLTASR
jgi:hypothetical protein